MKSSSDLSRKCRPSLKLQMHWSLLVRASVHLLSVREFTCAGDPASPRLHPEEGEFGRGGGAELRRQVPVIGGHGRGGTMRSGRM